MYFNRTMQLTKKNHSSSLVSLQVTQYSYNDDEAQFLQNKINMIKKLNHSDDEQDKKTSAPQGHLSNTSDEE